MTIDNIGKVLRQLDCYIDHVVKLNTWYTGDGTGADWRKAAEIRANAFRFPGPGATGVPVPGPYPAGIMLRQECMALRAASGDRLPRALSWPLGHWDWPIPVSFQQGLKIGKQIVLGGQISTDIHCKAVDPGDMRAQTRNVMEFDPEHPGRVWGRPGLRHQAHLLLQDARRPARPGRHAGRRERLL